MSLYDKWRDTIEASSETQEKQQEFWDDFCAKEQGIYESILAAGTSRVEGTIQELAEGFGVDQTYFMGFLDGINESIKKSNDLEQLAETDLVTLDIDFEKLYYNMLAVPAPWLYELEQWNAILSEEQRRSIEKSYKKSKIVVRENKVGRNDLCPCGSGKKYKKCCGKVS